MSFLEGRVQLGARPQGLWPSLRQVQRQRRWQCPGELGGQVKTWECVRCPGGVGENAGAAALQAGLPRLRR